jgi:hypothetical protein
LNNFGMPGPAPAPPPEAARPQFGTQPIGEMDTVYEFMNGRCHDFALGLVSFLRT